MLHPIAEHPTMSTVDVCVGFLLALAQIPFTRKPLAQIEGFFHPRDKSKGGRLHEACHASEHAQTIRERDERQAHSCILLFGTCLSYVERQHRAGLRLSRTFSHPITSTTDTSLPSNPPDVSISMTLRHHKSSSKTSCHRPSSRRSRRMVLSCRHSDLARVWTASATARGS